MLIVPRAVRTAVWLNTWLTGKGSTDSTINGLLGTDMRVEFDAVADPARLSPALWLGELRQLDVRRVSAAVPAPGDPTGLGGPPEFNADAMEAAGGVLLHGADLGLIPQHHEGVTGWSMRPAVPPTYLPDPDSADRDLRDVVRHAAEELRHLDVASWSPDATDVLLNLRAPTHFDAPMVFACPEAANLAAAALRCLQTAELALKDEGGAASAAEGTARRKALAPLQRAGRAALVAASSCTHR